MRSPRKKSFLASLSALLLGFSAGLSAPPPVDWPGSAWSAPEKRNTKAASEPPHLRMTIVLIHPTDSCCRYASGESPSRPLLLPRGPAAEGPPKAPLRPSAKRHRVAHPSVPRQEL